MMSNREAATFGERDTLYAKSASNKMKKEEPVDEEPGMRSEEDNFQKITFSCFKFKSK